MGQLILYHVLRCPKKFHFFSNQQNFLQDSVVYLYKDTILPSKCFLSTAFFVFSLVRVRLSNFQLLESLNCKHKLFRFGKLSTQNENNKSASETVNNDKM